MRSVSSAWRWMLTALLAVVASPPVYGQFQPAYPPQQPSLHPMSEPKAPPSSDSDSALSPNKSKLGSADQLIKEGYRLSQRADTTEDFTKIIELCKEGIAAGAENADYGRKLQAWACNKRGEKFSAAGKERAALDDFDAAVSLDPTMWRAVHNRGVSKATLGDVRGAIADLDRTVQMNPEYANAWFNRAELKYDQQDFNGAIADYTRAIDLQPRDAGYYNSRGHSYYRLGQFRDALSDYNRAVQLDPDDAAALVNRGDAFREQSIYGQAAADFRDAIKLNPKLGRAYVSAAWLMVTCPDARYRNADMGLEAAKRAVELDGTKDYRYLDTLAAACANAGDFAQAKEIGAKALNTAPARAKDRVRQRLELYEKQQAYREGGPPETVRAASRQQ